LMTAGFNIWSMSLDGTIEVAPGTPKYIAYAAFLQVYEERRRHAARGLTGDEERSRILVYADTLEIQDHIYGPTVSFSLTYRLACSLEYILAASGLWQPMSRTNSWDAWAEDQARWMGGGGGQSQLGHDSADDVIVDFCTGGTPKEQNIPLLPRTTAGGPRIRIPCPPAEYSWIEFNASVKIDRTSSVLTYTHPNLKDSEVPMELSDAGTVSITPEVIEGAMPADSVEAQSMGESLTTLTFYGYASRLGHKVPVPRITHIGGEKAVLLFQEVEPNKVLGSGALGRCPQYVTTWSQTYFFPAGANVDVRYAGVPPRYKDTIGIGS